MSSASGPNIIEEGLVLSLDPANTSVMPSTVNVLVVAGGGGGGTNMGGGGGGGGVINNAAYAVTAGTKYTVTVGTGGAGCPSGVGGHPTVQGTNGGNSVFGTLTAIGGGVGGLSPNTVGGVLEAGVAGGSGGGASGYNNDAQPLGTILGGAGTAGQGNRGGNQGDQYYSGGGGGAGAAGTDGNNLAHGGAGIQYTSISPYYWGGGGGGAVYSLATGGNGGLGGGGGAGGGTAGSGGTGGISNGDPGAANAGSGGQSNKRGGNGGANTGGGGGGGSHYQYSNQGGDGGSGIVMIKYVGPPAASGGSIEYDGTNTIHTFAASGVFDTSEIRDTSGKGNHGYLYSTATYSSDAKGSIDLVPTAGAIIVANSAGFNHGTSDFSYCIWHKWDTLQTYHTLFENGLYTQGILIRHITTAIQVYAEYTASVYVTSIPFSPTLGVWYHLTFTRNGNLLYFYVNGVLSLGSIAFGTGIDIIPNGVMAIGNSNHSGLGQGADGKIGLVTIYDNKYLTAAEVKQNFNASRQRYGL